MRNRWDNFSQYTGEEGRKEGGREREGEGGGGSAHPNE